MRGDNFASSIAPAELFEIAGDKLKLHFHSGQQRAWNSKARFVVMLAGTQGGKTSFGPHWLYREIQRCGAGDYMVVTPTFPLLDTAALPLFLTLFSKLLHLGRFVSSPRPKFIFSENGSRRTFGADWDGRTETRVLFGYAADSESLEAATAKAVWCDEAGQAKFRLASWEALLRRLSLQRGRALVSTTLYNLGWVKSQLFDRAKAGDKDIDVIQFESTENPRFSKEEFEDARKRLPRWKFNMFYRAVFERPAGLIYDCWDDATMTVPRFTLGKDWRHFLGLDFGTVNMAGSFWAEEPGTRRLFCYRTYHAGELSVAGHVRQLLHGELAGAPYTVGGSASEGEWRNEFRRAGLAVREPKFRDVELGIDRVYGAMQAKELFVFDDQIELLEEIHTYARKLDEAGNATQEIEDKEQYHLLDSMRYIVGDQRGTVPVGMTAGIIQRADPMLEIDRGGF